MGELEMKERETDSLILCSCGYAWASMCVCVCVRARFCVTLFFDRFSCVFYIFNVFCVRQESIFLFCLEWSLRLLPFSAHCIFRAHMLRTLANLNRCALDHTMLGQVPNTVVNR